MGIFPDAQGQQIRSPWSDLTYIRTYSSLYGRPYTSKNQEDPIKNEGARVIH